MSRVSARVRFERSPIASRLSAVSLTLLFMLTTAGCPGEEEDEGSSFIELRVDGQTVHVDCHQMDKDVSTKSPDDYPWIGGQSASTGVAFVAALPNDAASLEDGSFVGQYPLDENLSYGLAAEENVGAFNVKWSRYGATNMTFYFLDAGSAGHHRITSVTKVSSTAAGVTYRIRGEFQATMERDVSKLDDYESPAAVQTGLVAEGAWSLKVTYPPSTLPAPTGPASSDTSGH